MGIKLVVKAESIGDAIKDLLSGLSDDQLLEALRDRMRPQGLTVNVEDQVDRFLLKNLQPPRLMEPAE